MNKNKPKEVELCLLFVVGIVAEMYLDSGLTIVISNSQVGWQ